MPPPILTSLNPNFGSITGGMSIYLFGANYIPGQTTVNWGGLPITPTVLDGQNLTFIVPSSGVPNTVNVYVATPFGNSATLPFTYLYVITNLNPNSGSVSGGNTITVQGYGFINANAVQFDTGVLSPSITVLNDNFINAVVPAHIAGTVEVRVISPGIGFSTFNPPLDHYNYEATVLASVTGLSPNVGGSSGGDSVHIFGTGFSGTDSVVFDGTPVPQFFVQDDSNIEVLTPVHVAGATTVQVHTSAGYSPPNPTASTFTYFDVPTVSNVNPNSGILAGGILVTINGSGFGTNPSQVQVFFGSTQAASFSLMSPNQILAVNPSEPPGPVDVIVIVGGIQSIQNPGDVFTYDYPAVGGPNSPAAPCTKSFLFDRSELIPSNPSGASTTHDAILNLCDRVPAGKYVLVRNSQGRTLSQFASQGVSWNLRGMVFLVGDDTAISNSQTNLPISQQLPQIEYRPSFASGAQNWQVFQGLLQADQLGSAPVLGQYAGPQTLRSNKLVVGGLFILRAATFNNSAAASARAIANIRTMLNLDFVMIDIDDPIWNSPGAGQKLLILLQHIQQASVRSPMPPDLYYVSQHCPVFVIFNSTPQNFPNLLESDGCVEGLVNGYSGPKTIAAPRILASGDSTGLQNAWNWAKPINSNGDGMNHCEFVIDIRTNVSPTSLVNAAVLSDGLNVTFSGQPGSWNVNSGVIFYDDYDAALTTGVGGNPPDHYWSYNVNSRPRSIFGAIVPSFFPDPMPLAQVNHDWAYIDPSDPSQSRQHLTVGFENWRTGHISSNNYPTWVFVNDPQCGGGDTLPVLRNWISLNGTPMTTVGFSSFYQRGLTGRRLEFSGVPVSGDDGVYPFLITVQRGQTDTDLGTSFSFVVQVIDPSRVQVQGSFISSSGVPIPRPDLPGSFPQAGSLHSPHPRQVSTQRIPNDWTSFFDWCSGVKNVSAPTGSPIQSLPLPPRIAGAPFTPLSTCGFSYSPATIQPFIDNCSGALNGGFVLPMCDSQNKVNAYTGFVFSMMAVLSNMNPGYDVGNRKGILALDITNGVAAGYSAGNPNDPSHDLFSPAISIDLAQATIQNAWNQTITTDCVSNTFSERLIHAYLLAVNTLGNYPGSSPGPGCGQAPTGGGTPPGLGSIASIAGCVTPSQTNSYGTPETPPIYGAHRCWTICEMLTAAYASGFRDVGVFAGGETQLATIVAIALHESGGAVDPLCPDPNTSSSLVTTSVSQALCADNLGNPYPCYGILQFSGAFQLEANFIPNGAYDPYTAFRVMYGNKDTLNCVAGIPQSCRFRTGLSGPYSPDCTGPNNHCLSLPTVRSVINSGTCNFSGGAVPYNPPPQNIGSNNQTTLGSPLDLRCPSTQCCMSADCQWHLTNEGVLAVDIKAPGGTLIFSTCPGYITQRNFDGSDGYGNRVVIKCDSNPNLQPDPVYTRFGHMNGLSLSDPSLPQVNTHVFSGDTIGYVDTTGNSTGNHLHYEIMVGGFGPQFTVCPIRQQTSLLGQPGDVIPGFGSRGAAGTDYIGSSNQQIPCLTGFN